MTSIRHRRGTRTEWEAANPVLAEGEFGVELPSTPDGPPKLKVGDGVRTWMQMEYLVAEEVFAKYLLTLTSSGSLATGEDLAEVEQAIEDHIHAAEPHPAYDDMRSLTLLYRNGLI